MNTSKDEMADQSILLVDDDPGVLKAVSSVLADEGCQVASTSDSHCTLETLERNGFKLVITDLATPFIDRITLIRRAKDLNPRTKVVVMTAYQEPKCQAEAFALRTVGCLLQPFDLTDLKKSLQMSAAFRRSLKKLARYGQISKEMSRGTTEDEIGGWIALAWMKIIDVTLY